jgi:hypothetical protein
MPIYSSVRTAARRGTISNHLSNLARACSGSGSDQDDTLSPMGVVTFGADGSMSVYVYS